MKPLSFRVIYEGEKRPSAWITAGIVQEQGYNQPRVGVFASVVLPFRRYMSTYDICSDRHEWGWHLREAVLFVYRKREGGLGAHRFMFWRPDCLCCGERNGG